MNKIKKIFYLLNIVLVFFLFNFSVSANTENTENTENTTNTVAPVVNNKYKEMIVELDKRLTKASKLYQQQQASEAKQTVTNAYFQVFENIEGPIRINYSQEESLRLENTFAEIRRMITNKADVTAVNEKIEWLKAELYKVEKVLVEGHQLVAESNDDIYSNPQIDQYWRDKYKIIDDNLAKAMQAYEQKNYQQAKDMVNVALYDGYKNSGLETVLRTNKPLEENSEILGYFAELTKQITLPDQPAHQIGYQITSILDSLYEILPNLPIPDKIAEERKQQLTNTKVNWQKVKQNIEADINNAVELYKDGKIEDAIAAIQDSYFDIFEQSGMENTLGAKDNNLKNTIEANFTKLQALITAKKDQATLANEVTRLFTNLQQAVELLDTSNDGWLASFISALMIIVREGLEALLIVAAIVAYLVKSGHTDKLYLVKQSVITALILSVVTAVVFQLIFANSGVTREILEGVTMLIAVVVLFCMSFWLLSKVEAIKWKQYLQQKVDTSLSTGSMLGLWLTCFLAVYREGAETVLFYYALSINATSSVAHIGLIIGFIVGCIILAIIYFSMRYSVVKIPLKPFFMVTGIFMYVMAFTFTGNGISELIEGKVFQPTLIHSFFVPEIRWLGIYPYWETFLPQLLLILVAIISLVYLFKPKNQLNKKEM